MQLESTKTKPITKPQQTAINWRNSTHDEKDGKLNTTEPNGAGWALTDYSFNMYNHLCLFNFHFP